MRRTRRAVRPSPSRVADLKKDKRLFLPDAEHGRHDAFLALQRRHHGEALFKALGDEVAIEFRAGALVQFEREPEAQHARMLLRIHHIEQSQRFIHVVDDLECRARVAAEDPPATRQLHLLDRRAVSAEIVVGLDEVSIQRAGAHASERHERVGPATDKGRHFLHAQQIRPFGQPAQRGNQCLAQRTRTCVIAGSIQAEQRRIVVGKVKIGEFDEANASPRAANERYQRDLAMGRGVINHRDQRRSRIKRAIPGVEPPPVLKARAPDVAAPARCRHRPVAATSSTRNAEAPDNVRLFSPPTSNTAISANFHSPASNRSPSRALALSQPEYLFSVDTAFCWRHSDISGKVPI